MSEFVKTSFDQVLLEPISGSRPKGGVNTEGDIPSLGGENVTMTGGVKFYPVKKISSEFYKSMSRGHLQNLDVLINKDGANTGKSGIYRNSPYRSAAVNEHLFILRGKEGVLEQEYLHYLLQLPSVRKILDTKITGSAQPGFNTSFVQNFPIDLAPISEQKKIASILTSVDEVIENTQKQIDKLQDLKKATSNELFTKGIGHEEFKDSQLGKIPKSWEIKEIQKVSTVIRGASPRPKGDPRYYGGNVPRLMGSDVTRDGKYVIPKTDFLTTEGAKLSRPMKKGGLTIVCSGTVGVPSILGIDACIHDGFIGLIDIDDSCSTEFLYYTFLPLQEKLDSSATHGGIFTNLTTEILKEFLIKIPPIEEQCEIVKYISSIDEGLKKQYKKLFQTQFLKKSLVQDLLTGKVRVKVN